MEGRDWTEPANPIPNTSYYGLTKRELIAIAAMQGQIAGNPSTDYDEAADHAVGYADALLKKLAE